MLLQESANPIVGTLTLMINVAVFKPRLMAGIYKIFNISFIESIRIYTYNMSALVEVDFRKHLEGSWGSEDIKLCTYVKVFENFLGRLGPRLLDGLFQEDALEEHILGPGHGERRGMVSRFVQGDLHRLDTPQAVRSIRCREAWLLRQMLELLDNFVIAQGLNQRLFQEDVTRPEKVNSVRLILDNSRVARRQIKILKDNAVGTVYL